MKKFLVLIVLLIAGATASYGQWYVGGSVNLSSGSEKADSEKIASEFGVGLYPRIGYQLNDRMSIGVEIGYNHLMSKEHDTDLKAASNMFAFLPFMRYDFVKMGKFSISGDTRVGFLWEKSTAEQAGSKAPSFYVNNIVVGFTPVLTFDISRHITLETRLDFLSLSYVSGHAWISGANVSMTRFSFGLDGDNLFTTGDFTFGMIYRF